MNSNNILEYKGRTFIIGSYAVHHALESIGFSLSTIHEAIDKNFFGLINGVIFYSAEYYFKRKGEASDFSELDVYEFLDSAGGYNGDFIQNFTRVVLATLNPVGAGDSGPVETSTNAPSKKKKSLSKKTASST